MWSLTIGVLLVAGVALGLWGLISYLSWDIQQKIETRRELAGEIEEQQQTVERLHETTCGGGAGHDRRGTEVRGAAGGDVSPRSALDSGRASHGWSFRASEGSL